MSRRRSETSRVDRAVRLFSAIHYAEHRVDRLEVSLGRAVAALSDDELGEYYEKTNEIIDRTNERTLGRERAKCRSSK